MKMQACKKVNCHDYDFCSHSKIHETFPACQGICHGSCGDRSPCKPVKKEKKHSKLIRLLEECRNEIGVTFILADDKKRAKEIEKLLNKISTAIDTLEGER
jgi:hypothetical protein